MVKQENQYYDQEDFAPPLEDYAGEDFEDFEDFESEYDDDGELFELDDDYDDEGEAFETEDDDFGEMEFDDDDDAGDAEFLGILSAAAPLAIKGVGAAIKGISRSVKKRRASKRSRAQRYTRGGPRGRRVRNIPRKSRVQGRIRTRSGRSVRFRLPPHVAVKSDVLRLQRAVNGNASGIRKLTKAVNNTAKSVVKSKATLAAVDRKHTSATTKQNRILSSMTKQYSGLKKELDGMKQQSQMQMLLPMLMGNDLKTITVKPDSDAATPFAGGTGTLEIEKSTGGDDNLPLLMMMSGGFGGSGGSGMNNPMMMFMMMEMMKD